MMRQFRDSLSKKKSFRLIKMALGLSTSLFCAWQTSSAFATPVYLNLESRFPSGHHHRQWLEGRTKRVQFQRWMRVQTNEKVYGWLPEDYLLTPLKLATEAVLSEDVPLRSDTQLDSIGRQTIAKGTRVLLLEFKGSWVRTQPLPGSEHRESWIPSESLKPLADAQTTKAFLNRPAAVYILPGMHARILGQMEGASFVQVTKIMTDWLEIRYRGGIGYIRRAEAWTQKDLGEKSVHLMIDQAPLRSAALPYADLIKSLPLATSLTLLQTKTVRWGQVKVPDIGEVWWPISDDFDDEKDSGPTAAVKLGTSELFHRKIFDMASSPAIPSLKFASAQGVFRTLDGQEWIKVPVFQDNNFPIAIASGGSVFIGPFVSDDHGETFEQWIRWDSLVATLKNKYKIAPKELQILGIKPEDGSGRKVSLRLNIGLPKPVQVTTDDQGINWKAY